MMSIVLSNVWQLYSGCEAVSVLIDLHGKSGPHSHLSGPRQNSRRFADGISKFTFLIENCCVF